MQILGASLVCLMTHVNIKKYGFTIFLVSNFFFEILVLVPWFFNSNFSPLTFFRKVKGLKVRTKKVKGLKKDKISSGTKKMLKSLRTEMIIIQKIH